MIHHCNCWAFIILVLFTIPLHHFLFSRYLSLTKHHFSSDFLVPFPDSSDLYSHIRLQSINCLVCRSFSFAIKNEAGRRVEAQSLDFSKKIYAYCLYLFMNIWPILDIEDIDVLFGAHFLEKRAFCLLTLLKQMSFLTISNKNIFFKTQGNRLGAIVAPNKRLE